MTVWDLGFLSASTSASLSLPAVGVRMILLPQQNVKIHLPEHPTEVKFQHLLIKNGWRGSGLVSLARVKKAGLPPKYC